VSHVSVEGWPDDDDPQTWDLVCRLCGDRARMNARDGFVDQVALFSSQHHHDAADPPV
jgi:hypothetical protein